MKKILTNNRSKKLNKKIKQKKIRKKRRLCEDCNTNKDVTRGACPYQLEAKDIVVIVDLCPKCYKERSEES